jgi:uncharacterized protein (DUF849 family)
MEKLIITAAITGAGTMPSQTPYLPITPQEIADQAVEAAKAGAASVHIHARNPKDGKPTAELDVYRQIVTDIKRRSNVVVCITTGGSGTASPQERISVVPEFKPELASFNVGSFSSAALCAVARGARDFKYDWEKPFLEYLQNWVFANTGVEMEFFAKTMLENDSKPEHEAYDVGHLTNIAHLVREGLVKTPLWVQFVMGGFGAIPGTPESLLHMKHTADSLLGADNYRWSVIGVGYPTQFNLATMAIMMGGHVRVGLEDNIYVRKKTKAKSNAELVEKVVRLANEFDREIATPDDVRQMLGLKGKDKVNY